MLQGEYNDADGVKLITLDEIPVYEMVVNGVSVFRRVSDGFVSASQIIKAALSEPHPNPEELAFMSEVWCTIQKDDRNWGAWVPLETARLIARDHGIEDTLSPLIDSNPVNVSQPPSELEQQEPLSFTQSVPFEHAKALHEAISTSWLDDWDIEADIKALLLGPSEPAEIEALEEPSLRDDQRVVLMHIYTTDDGEELLDILASFQPAFVDSILNLVLDLEGNTCLHWAAQMGQAKTVEALIDAGADWNVRNLHGGTPLMRAVAQTNCYENDSFGDIFNTLGPLARCVDTQGRTFLHHLALSSRDKARRPAARCYLNCVFEACAKGTATLDRTFVTCPDAAGNTALTIAKTCDDLHLYSALIDYLYRANTSQACNPLDVLIAGIEAGQSSRSNTAPFPDFPRGLEPVQSAHSESGGQEPGSEDPFSWQETLNFVNGELAKAKLESHALQTGFSAAKEMVESRVRDLEKIALRRISPAGRLPRYRS
ncbi:ankyrin repeat-containing domain protein [Fimicolochytrium jonesii]|uniref:ankyrin repeat-containing domain protein n=1 Tax=Fimicolochytrium jonesii TaxID=1396493 RepID=UPI0022FDBD0B|nr:ankyrin repeat-containing domain protein [Fimicolochytrium jonesii]KAI8823440.1 ankyrin repeat-containing domain protein [Fimicolochytrium jonesii]